MNKMFNLTSTFKSEAQEDGSVMVRGMASTADFDRAGDSILSEAWGKGGLGNFEKNPIILFNHDYNKPIGRATKVTPTKDGLHMEAKISKHAECAELIKDGVLGAFSVGFRVKDADYMKETDGLQIKDAELFEVSVVSVPCNQAATFSLAKSFDSEQDYEDFKKTFKSEEVSSSQEIEMSEEVKTPEIDLEAFAKKVAEETAAKIAMKQSEQRAAEKAEVEKATADAEAKALEAEKIQATIKSGIETGAEKLIADVEKDIKAAKETELAEVIKKYEADLKEKADELEAMRNSKKSFDSRTAKPLSDFGKEFLQAKVLAAACRTAFIETKFGQDLLEKVGVDYATNAGSIDTIVSTQFEEEVRFETQVAGLFTELPVTSGATVLPIALDPSEGTFMTGGLGDTTSAGQLTTASNSYQLSQKVVNAHRLLAGTYIDNNTEEQVVVSVLPIITSALARAHAKAIDKAILVGNASGVINQGLIGAAKTDDANGYSSAAAAVPLSTGSAATVTAATANLGPTPESLLRLRAQMGKYGYNPSDVAFIVPMDVYYTLIDAQGFTDISEVGQPLATKLNGVVGTVFGSRVIATEVITSGKIANSGGGAYGGTCALAVNTSNYLIPRLRGVNIETEYSVKEQRTNLVASQSLGFEELIAASGNDKPSIRLPFA